MLRQGVLNMPEEEINPKPNSQLANIIITQAICIALILIAVLITKYFFKDTYNELKIFYEQQICADTDINEVIGEENEI